MSEGLEDYEQVSVYPLDPDIQEQLLTMHRECVLMWSTKDGWPVGVIHSYLWKNGRFWITAGVHRHRIAAIRRDPRVSVVVTSTGTPLGPGKTVTAKGRCIIHEDRETKEWFYPEFSAHLNPDNAELAAGFAKRLDSPLRVVLEVVPEKFITYDGVKMALDTVGKLPPEKKGPPKSADVVRLPRELKARGLT